MPHADLDASVGLDADVSLPPPDVPSSMPNTARSDRELLSPSGAAPDLPHEVSLFLDSARDNQADVSRSMVFDNAEASPIIGGQQQVHAGVADDEDSFAPPPPPAPHAAASSSSSSLPPASPAPVELDLSALVHSGSPMSPSSPFASGHGDASSPPFSPPFQAPAGVPPLNFAGIEAAGTATPQKQA